MTPYKYIIVSLPRSMSYWLSHHLHFDHDVSVGFAAGCLEQKSEGCVDTGLYAMDKEFQDKLIAPDAKIIRVRRRLADIMMSFQKHFPDADLVAISDMVDRLHVKMNNFCTERNVTASVSYPIDSVSFTKITQFFHGEPEAFSEKMDLMNDRTYKNSIKQSLPSIFGQ